jgi:pimeloyl-ACP methyl ester carboxylesterase
VALLYASRNPVPQMVLVDAAGVKPRRSLKYWVKVYSFKAIKKLAPLLFGKARAQEIIERRRNASGSADYRAASPVMRATLSRVVNEDLRGVMSLVKASTLLVWGEKDTDTPLSDARKMERLIPDAGLVVFAGAGHFSFIEQPARFAAVINSFLSENNIR